MESNFSEGTNLKFIHAIKSRPCLYDSSAPGYNNKFTQYLAWEEVAKIMSWKVLMCRDRWKNLRSVTLRHVKRVARGIRKRPYYLMDAMKFILPFTKNAESILPKFLENDQSANDNNSEEQDDNDEDVQELEDEDEIMCEIQSPATNILSRESSPQPQESSNFILLDIKTEEFAPEDEPNTNYIQDSLITENNAKDLTALTTFVDEQHEIKKGNIDDDKPNSSNIPKIVKTETYTKIKDKSPAPLQLQDDVKKMFLLSLLPDVYAMSDVQMRAFKRGVLNLIGDILEDSGPSTN